MTKRLSSPNIDRRVAAMSCFRSLVLASGTKFGDGHGPNADDFAPNVRVMRRGKKRNTNPPAIGNRKGLATKVLVDLCKRAPQGLFNNAIVLLSTDSDIDADAVAKQVNPVGTVRLDHEGEWLDRANAAFSSAGLTIAQYCVNAEGDDYPATASTPTTTASVVSDDDPLKHPDWVGDDDEPEPLGTIEKLDLDLAASRATIARLEAEIRSLTDDDKPHPLADIMVSPHEVAEKAKEYDAPPAMVSAVKAIRLGLDSSDPEKIKSLLDLAGPAGSGKSMAACWIAHTLGWCLVKIDCSLLEDTGKAFFLSLGAKAGSTTDAPSHFTRAIQEPKTVVLLDEVSRAPMTAQNGLLPIFDGYGVARVALTNGETMTVSRAPKTVAVMARNEGREYVGAGAIDAALLSRANKITLVPPKAKVARRILVETGCPTKTINKLVFLYVSVYRAKLGWQHGVPEVDRIPAEAVSLRSLTSVAAAVASGIDEETAFRMGIYSHMKVNTRNADPVQVLAAQCGHTLEEGEWTHTDMKLADKLAAHELGGAV